LDLTGDLGPCRPDLVDRRADRGLLPVRQGGGISCWTSLRALLAECGDVARVAAAALA